MAQRLSDYFALEAADYLDQLDRMLAASDAPDAERFFRLARGIRGSAQLAEARRVAEVAQQLESAARGLAEQRLSWSQELHASAVRTVDDLRVLVRGLAAWGSAEEARAHAAIERWSSALPAATAGGTGAGAKDGARLLPFVHMELIGVRGELDRATLALESAPGDAEPLRAVLHRMRAVRGIQGYAVLQPTLHMLAALDDAVRAIIARAPEVGAAQMALLSSARALLSACIDQLAAGEAPSEDGAAWVQFHELATGVAAEQTAAGPDVVPIRTLFHDDAGPHLVYSPVAPLPPAAGEEPDTAATEFLHLEATGLLDRAEAALAESAGGEELAELAAALRELAALYGQERVAAAADEAARAFATARTSDESFAALARLRARLAGEEAAIGVAEETEMKVDEPATEVEAEVVPIESLLLQGEAAARAALALRAEVERRVAEVARGGSTELLREAIDEVFALIQLALEPAPAG
jgi:chemotaxis protein histidine kinase CheA